MLREFRVGYAPSAWDRVLLASRRGGFSEEELYDTGLAQRSKQNGRPYDRFRSRIMFPLADIRGRVLGFGARAMSEEQRPKYLNTSDNDVYHKGLHLYGVRSGPGARDEGGRGDPVRGLHGHDRAAPGGDAQRGGPDGDGADRRSGGRARQDGPDGAAGAGRGQRRAGGDAEGVELAAKRKLELRVVPLPAGTDPAELIQRDGRGGHGGGGGEVGAVRALPCGAGTGGGRESSPEGRDRIIEELRPVFATLPPSAMRMELTRIVSGRLELPERLAEKLLAAAARVRGCSRWAGLAAGRGRRHARGHAGARPGNGARGAPAAVRTCRAGRRPSARSWRCASPRRRRASAALAGLDIDEHFSSGLLRRAARHLREGRPARADARPRRARQDRWTRTRS